MLLASNARSSFSISPAAAGHLLSAGSDWDLVLSFAHYSGDFYKLLNREERQALLLLADGFGDLRGYRGRGRADMLADWSHVRDSSEAAVTRMAGAIRQWVKAYTK